MFGRASFTWKSGVFSWNGDEAGGDGVKKIPSSGGAARTGNRKWNFMNIRGLSSSR